MARVRLRPGLAASIMAGPARRAVDRVTDRAERAVREHAPDAKEWDTEADERVRHSHAEAHGQNIPANIPYRLVRVPEPGKQEVPAGWDLADKPRDPGLPVHQRINCRCESRTRAGAIAGAVSRTSVQVGRTRVSAKVIVTYPRIAESEFAEQGGGWLAAAARSASART